MADAKESKENKKEAGKEEKTQDKRASPQAAQSIVRISGKDVNGALSIERAITNVKGIGSNMSYILSSIIESKLGIPRTTSIGSLTEAQIASVEQVIKTPSQYGVPNYILNRNKDMETGLTVHNTGSDFLFATRQDVNRDITMKVWRGFRHQYGQRVRGQHTRSTGRTGATVGVTKKAVRDAQKASRATGGATEKKSEAAAAPAAAAAAPAKK